MTLHRIGFTALGAAIGLLVFLSAQSELPMRGPVASVESTGFTLRGLALLGLWLVAAFGAWRYARK